MFDLLNNDFRNKVSTAADLEGVWGLLVLSETKLYHFHGIYKKNDIKSTRRIPYTFIHLNPLSRNPRSTFEVSMTMKYHNHRVNPWISRKVQG